MHMLYLQPETAPPLGTSDHDVVTREPAVLSSFFAGQKVEVTTRVMGQNERAMFAMDLCSIDWTLLYHLPTYAEQHDFFYVTLHNLVGKHFPLKTTVLHTGEKPHLGMQSEGDKLHTKRKMRLCIECIGSRSIECLHLSCQSFTETR